MSDGKGADDLHVFDELLKSKSSDQTVDPNSSAAWRGGTLPPPPIRARRGAHGAGGTCDGSPSYLADPIASSAAAPRSHVVDGAPMASTSACAGTRFARPSPPPRSASGFTEAPPIRPQGPAVMMVGAAMALRHSRLVQRQPFHVASCRDRTRGPFESAPPRCACHDGPIAVLSPSAADLAQLARLAPLVHQARRPSS